VRARALSGKWDGPPERWGRSEGGFGASHDGLGHWDGFPGFLSGDGFEVGRIAGPDGIHRQGGRAERPAPRAPGGAA